MNKEKVAKLLIEIDKLVNKQLIKIELLQQRKKPYLNRCLFKSAEVYFIGNDDVSSLD